MSETVSSDPSLPSSRAETDLLARQAVATVKQLGAQLPEAIKARIYQDVVRNLAIKAGLNPREQEAAE